MRLIDGDKLHDLLEVRCKLTSGTSRKAFGVVIEDVCNAPTIDPVKHGRWVITRNGNFIRNTCSVCNSFLDSDDSCIMDTYSYCPSCGARMDAP